MTRLPLAILISGRGSNMQALIKACSDPAYPAYPAVIVSNRPDAAGLTYAADRNIPTEIVDHRRFKGDREAFEQALHEKLSAHKVEMIALAGFMRILTPWFVRLWQNRLVNIHPSLLPKYRGLDTHARALAAGDIEAGCTVHWVSEGVDTGEIIAQARVPVQPEDTEASLARRVLAAEHELYPAALASAIEHYLGTSKTP